MPPKPKRTAEQLELIADLERLEGRRLSWQEQNLALVQAWVLGEIESEPAILDAKGRPKKRRAVTLGR